MPQPPTPIGFISLGCPKATVDSERILSQLRAEGYAITPSYDEAELVIVNTCGFIDDAVAESLEAIGEALDENGRVIVTGCLGAREAVIREAHPKVLAITGPDSADAVLAVVHEHLPPAHDPFTDLLPPGGVKLTPRHTAWLKISEGCNHRCTFCVIPQLRGDLDSRAPGEVLGEAEALVAAGVRELAVVAQDTSAYGVDVRYRTDFWGGRPVKTRITELVRELGDIAPWVRLHYIYPYPHVDELVELMAEGRVLPYLDVPLQHASPAVLKAMKRPANAENALRRIEAWRSTCPELTLRSTFVVGFPGETEADFERLLEFVEAAGIDRAGAFAYSPVEGAPANTLPDPVPEEVKAERLERLMLRQGAISAQRLARRIGRNEVVLVDSVAADGTVYARSAAEAPEVDGQIAIDDIDPDDIAAGDFIEVTITGADEHDMTARLAD